MLPLFQVKNRKFKELRINEIYELSFYTCMNTYCMQYKFCSLLLEILFLLYHCTMHCVSYSYSTCTVVRPIQRTFFVLISGTNPVSTRGSAQGHQHAADADRLTGA